MTQERGAASTVGGLEDRDLTEYERGYLDGMLSQAYWSDGEAYVGPRKRSTYRQAVLRFLLSRGIDATGWDVKVSMPEVTTRG